MTRMEPRPAEPASSRPTSSSFRIRSRLEISVDNYRGVFVSAPALSQTGTPLEAKDLISVGEVSSTGKYTLDEHLAFLALQGLLAEGQPLLILGLRNNLVNPRAVAMVSGRAIGAAGEDPARSERPYYGIGLQNGRFVAESAYGPSGKPTDPFWAGIPVLWDGLSDAELLDHILIEAADHSHVFDLPRGNHPDATDATRAAWCALNEVFVRDLYAEAPTAIENMKSAVGRLPFPLKRSETYQHSILGVDENGGLVNVVAQGRLEDLGRMAAVLGCRRAICVENSGSIMPTFLPEGIQGSAIPLLRAPNFRPKGRMLLVIELENGFFGPLCQSGS